MKQKEKLNQNNRNISGHMFCQKVTLSFDFKRKLLKKVALTVSRLEFSPWQVKWSAVSLGKIVKYVLSRESFKNQSFLIDSQDEDEEKATTLSVRGGVTTNLFCV